LEAAAKSGFFRLTRGAEGLRVGAACAGVGATLCAVFAGGHVGTIKAARAGCGRERIAAISVSAAFTLSGRGRYRSRSDRQRSKGRNNGNLSHERSPSQCVIAHRFVISGLMRDRVLTGETNEGSFSGAQRRSSLKFADRRYRVVCVARSGVANEPSFNDDVLD
jgi:hypothetical protein